MCRQFFFPFRAANIPNKQNIYGNQKWHIYVFSPHRIDKNGAATRSCFKRDVFRAANSDLDPP